MATLRIVTYNIRRALGMDGRTDIARIASLLREIDADIACLQEVETYCPRSGMDNQPAKLSSLLGMHTIFGRNYGLGPFCGFGNVILSKLPLYSTWNKHLPTTIERRGLLKATTIIAGADVTIFCTHFGLSQAERTAQAKQCADEIAAACTNRGILCGDFNSRLDSMELAPLFKGDQLQALDIGSYPATYPSNCPQYAIDLIVTTGQLRINALLTRHSLASDHLPLIAEIELI